MSKASHQRVSALAKVYAQSLYELADSDGGLSMCETIGLELSETAQVATDDAGFREFLQSPIINSKDKEGALRAIFGNGLVNDLLLRFYLVLNQKGRLDQLSAISHAYQAAHWDRTGKVLVEVTSASELDPGLAESVRQRIGAVLGREAVIESVIDPSLIGGLRLRVGDRMIDASVATRLGKMSEALRTGGSEAVRSRLNELLVD